MHGMANDSVWPSQCLPDSGLLTSILALAGQIALECTPNPSRALGYTNDNAIGSSVLVFSSYPSRTIDMNAGW